MSINLPQVTVVGTLTADPELRFTQSGKAVLSLTIASNSRKLDKATGEWKEADATFLRGTVWDKYAENVAESLVKGARVVATGVLKQRDFETREGEKRTSMELEVDEIGPSLRWATATVTRAAKVGASSTASAKPAGNTGWDNDSPDW